MKTTPPNHRLQQDVRAMARRVTRGNRELADELEQDVLLVALNSAPEDPKMKGSWLWAITRNKFRFKRFQTASGLRRVELGQALEPASDDSDPGITVGRAELTALLADLVSTLPPIYREAIELRVMDGLPPREVAKRLGVPVETVRTRVDRGMKRLRSQALVVAGEDDARWKWGVGLTTLNPPLHRAKKASGLAAISIGAFPAMLWLSGWSRPAIVPIEPPAAMGSQLTAAPGELDQLTSSATGPVDRRPPNIADLASVELKLVDEEGVPWEEFRLDLRSTRERRAREATVRAGYALIEGLSLGALTAWDGARNVGSIDLVPGLQEWQLTIPRLTQVTIDVAGLDGAPSVGAEVYARVGMDGAVDLLGVTGLDGTLETSMAIQETWVAARGPVGLRTKARLVDQPLTESDGHRLRLVMREFPTRWIHLELPSGLDHKDLTVRRRLLSPKGFIRTQKGDGVCRTSGWVPAWRDAAGRFGLSGRHQELVEVIDPSGQVLWIGRPSLEDDALAVSAPSQVTGTVVDSMGHPVTDLPIALLPFGKGTKPVARAVTDHLGAFVVQSCPVSEASLVCNTGTLAPSTSVSGPGPFSFGEVAANTRSIGLRWPKPGRSWRITPIVAGNVRSSTLMDPAELATSSSQLLTSTETAMTFQFTPERTQGLYIQTTDNLNFRATILSRPPGGWGVAPYHISERMTQPALLSAAVDRSVLPVRGHWIERDSGIQVTALVNQETGVVESDAVPAGNWSLWLVGKDGAAIQSERREIQPGGHEDWGLLDLNSGSLRIIPPDSWRGRDGKVTLRIEGVRARGEGVEFVVRHWKSAWELPPFVDIRVPIGMNAIRMSSNGEVATSIVTVEPGCVTDTDLALGRSLLRVEFARHALERDPGLELELLNGSGASIERWSQLASLLRGNEGLVLTIPIAAGRTLVVRNGQGQELTRQRAKPGQRDIWRVNLQRELRERRAAAVGEHGEDLDVGRLQRAR